MFDRPGHGGVGLSGGRVKDAAKTARRIVAAFSPYKTKVALILGTILLSTAFGLVNPLLTRLIFDDAIGNRDLQQLVVLVSLMMVTPVASGGVGVAQTYWTTLVGQSVVRDLRNRLYRHLQRMSLRFFTSTRTGEIQSRLANDVGGLQGVLTNTATGVISNAATVTGSVLAMVFISPMLTFISLCFIPLFLWLTHRTGKIRRKTSMERQCSLAAFNAITHEALSISGMLLTKTFGRESYAIDVFARENDRLADLEVRQQMTGRWLFMSVGLFFALATALIYLAAGWQIIRGSPLGPPLTLGTVVAFIAIQSRLFFPMTQLLNVHVEIQGALALFERVFEYLDSPVELADKTGALHLDAHRAEGHLAFRDVSFAYEAGHAPANDGAGSSDGLTPRMVLMNVSFEVKPGQLVALVGASGAGKTTITYLVPRLYDVSGGAVEIDGHDVRDIARASLNDLVGIVTQEPYLLHASIRENLRYARPGATEEAMVAATTTAAIHDRILELPEGYDTVIGERGFKLSGGEKQRLAIARVILKDPRILVLDEATSALDSQTERLIKSALDQVMQGRTTLAIAHRLSTILMADMILVVDRGEIVERGTHQQLLRAGGFYYRLYHEQFAGALDHRREMST